MNCVNHPEQPAVAFCRTCGKALCGNCKRPEQGTVFCEEHFPAAAGSPYPGSYGPPPYSNAAYNSAHSPYTSNPGVSPGLAFILGLIPGVGAIYNGQYGKGLIHAVIFGILVSIIGSGAARGMEPLIGIMTGLWFFYMAFEAYHTALRRQRGEVVDEFSSIFPVQHRSARGFPVGPVLMIALGIVFLLNTLDLVRLYDILRFWPVFLIAFGAYLLYVRLADRDEAPPTAPEELTNER
jgi:TM2 domain-containing membrane protein YozV